MKRFILALMFVLVAHAEIFEVDYWGDRKLSIRLKQLHKNPKLYSIGKFLVHAKDGRLQMILHWTEEIK